jgi:hypothetical protein
MNHKLTELREKIFDLKLNNDKNLLEEFIEFKLGNLFLQLESKAYDIDKLNSISYSDGIEGLIKHDSLFESLDYLQNIYFDLKKEFYFKTTCINLRDFIHYKNQEASYYDVLSDNPFFESDEIIQAINNSHKDQTSYFYETIQRLYSTQNIEQVFHIIISIFHMIDHHLDSSIYNRIEGKAFEDLLVIESEIPKKIETDEYFYEPIQDYIHLDSSNSYINKNDALNFNSFQTLLAYISKLKEIGKGDVFITKYQFKYSALNEFSKSHTLTKEIEKIPGSLICFTVYAYLKVKDVPKKILDLYLPDILYLFLKGDMALLNDEISTGEEGKILKMDSPKNIDLYQILFEIRRKLSFKPIKKLTIVKDHFKSIQKNEAAFSLFKKGELRINQYDIIEKNVLPKLNSDFSDLIQDELSLLKQQKLDYFK